MCYLSLRPSVYDRKRRAIASVTLSLNITVHKIFGSAADDSAAGSAADGSAADGSAADGSAADDSVAGTVATASAAVRLGLHALRCTLVIAARAPPAPASFMCLWRASPGAPPWALRQHCAWLLLPWTPRLVDLVHLAGAGETRLLATGLPARGDRRGRVAASSSSLVTPVHGALPLPGGIIVGLWVCRVGSSVKVTREEWLLTYTQHS